MCWIGVHPGGVLPVPEDLARAAYVNGDGSGAVIVRPGKDGRRQLEVFRSVDEPGETIAWYLNQKHRHPGADGGIHFRLATADPFPSPVTYGNCQPVAFQTVKTAGQEREPQTVLLHNGTFPQWAPAGGMSDTVRYVEACGTWAPRTRQEAALLQGSLDAYVAGTGSRAVMFSDQHATPAWQLLNSGQWLTCDDGGGRVWYASNADHLGPGAGWDDVTLDGKLYRFNVTQPGQCPSCHQLGHDPAGCTNPAAARPWRWRCETDRAAAVAAASRAVVLVLRPGEAGVDGDCTFLNTGAGNAVVTRLPDGRYDFSGDVLQTWQGGNTTSVPGSFTPSPAAAGSLAAILRAWPTKDDDSRNKWKDSRKQ